MKVICGAIGVSIIFATGFAAGVIAGMAIIDATNNENKVQENAE